MDAYNKQIHPVDTHVGNRLRLRRVAMGFSQNDLGAALGITFQQVQKYEKGTNRIGASRLFELANTLKVDIQYFYGGLSGSTSVNRDGGISEQEMLRILSTPEGQKLYQSFFDIKDEDVKQKLLALMETIGHQYQDEKSPVSEKNHTGIR